jgi:glutamyl-tRNA reductase
MDCVVRKEKTVYVDIGAPRNIDPEVGRLDFISLYSIDDLNRVVETNRTLRRHSADRAREIIETAVDEFVEWFASLSVIPLVLTMREHHEALGVSVLQKWKNKVSPEVYEILERFNEELIAKILHEPSAQIKRLGAAGLGLESRLILEKLFDLKADQDRETTHE